MLVALPASAQPQQAILTDAVTGRAGLTYLDLARLAMPDIAPDGQGFPATPPAGLRHIVPNYAARPTPGRTPLYDVIAQPVVSGGRDRLVLIIDFGPALQPGEGFAIMALYDLASEPKLLDMANVAMGYQTYLMFPSTLYVGAGQTVLMSAGYDQTEAEARNGVAMTLVRDDKLELLDNFALLSHFSCATNFNQNAEFSVIEPTKPYLDIQVAVTETVDVTGQACPGETAPVASSRTITAVYRWNALKGAYFPDSDALGQLEDETARKFRS